MYLFAIDLYILHTRNNAHEIVIIHFTDILSYEDRNDLTIYCNDTLGFLGASSSRYYIDTVFPQINFIPPTFANYETTNISPIKTNISIDETGGGACNGRD